MREIPISSNIYFTDDVKRAACKKISILIKKNNEAYLRVKLCLDSIGVNLLEELPINYLKLILKVEEAWENDTIGEVLTEEGIKRGFFLDADKSLQ